MKRETLIRALDRFSEFTYDEVCKMHIWEYEDGQHIAITFHQACQLASDWLSQRDIDAMKYRYMKAELKRRGMENFYEALMNEPLT
jgi:hypothetical protein